MKRRSLFSERPGSQPGPGSSSGVVPGRAPEGATHDGQALGQLPLAFGGVEIRGEGEPPLIPPLAYSCTPGSRWIDDKYGDEVEIVCLHYGAHLPGYRVRYKWRGGQYTVGLGIFLNEYRRKGTR
jgi:hypothetical protein